MDITFALKAFSESGKSELSFDSLPELETEINAQNLHKMERPKEELSHNELRLSGSERARN